MEQGENVLRRKRLLDHDEHAGTEPFLPRWGYTAVSLLTRYATNEVSQKLHGH